MIEVVGSRSCRPCRMLKSRLLADGYEFTYMDANDENQDRVKEIKQMAIELNAKHIPILVVNGNVVACGMDAVKYEIPND